MNKREKKTEIKKSADADLKNKQVSEKLNGIAFSRSEKDHLLQGRSFDKLK